jgi:hypothetical protein
MSNRATALTIFFLSLWSLAALAPQDPTNSQVVTRLALAITIVDSGTLEITPFGDWTIDKAAFGDHAYADKTPGHPFLALPAVALTKLARRLTGGSTDARDFGVFADYARWATLGTNVLISACAIALLFIVALDLGASRLGAIFAAFCLGWATPFLGWSTAFFAHSVTGSFLLFGLAWMLRLFPLNAPRPVPSPAKILLLGVLLGYTLVIDLTAAPAVLILGLFALWRIRKSGIAPRAIGTLAIGGIVGLLPLLAYNEMAFGSPLNLGYAHTAFVGMNEGFFGLGWPDPTVLVKLLFGFYRGLLPLSPILLLVPLGLAAMAQSREQRGASVVIALIIVTYLWINASYAYWYGGWSTGPRHLVATLPPAALSLAFVQPARWLGKLAVSVLLAASLCLSLACALAGMFAEQSISDPIVDWVLPHLMEPHQASRAIFVVLAWVVLAILLIRRPHRDMTQREAERSDALRPA